MAWKIIASFFLLSGFAVAEHVAPAPRLVEEKEAVDWAKVARGIKAPCNPNDFPARELVLHGEKHTTFVAESHRRFRLFQAEQKTCVVAHEGIVCGDPESKKKFLSSYSGPAKKSDDALVYGIENAKTYGLGLVLVYQMLAGMKDVDDEVDKYYRFSRFMKRMPRDAFLREAWQAFRKKKVKLSAEAEEIASIVDEGMTGTEEAHQKRVDTADAKKPFQKRRDAFFELLPYLTDECADLLVGKYQQETYAPSDLKAQLEIFKEKSDELGPGLLKAIFMNNVIVRWRDLHMAIAIAKAYCEALRQKLPFRTLLGSAHVEGVTEFLKIIFGPDVPIRATHYDRDVEDALRAFDDWVQRQRR